MKFSAQYKCIIILTLFIFPLSCSDNNRARHFNETAADTESKPDRILEALNIKKTDVIADLGAGGGYFTFKFSRLTDSTVYAVDINRNFLSLIEENSQKKGIGNVKTILAKEDDALLPEHSIDLIFIRNVFHHLKNPAQYFLKLKKSLKPGGRIAVIEYKKKGTIHKYFGHSTDEESITRAMKMAGFRVMKKYDFLKKQSFHIFIIE